jgi:hypothetical protein
MHQYPGQMETQDRYIEVRQDGKLHIDWNAEIGNAVPAPVWHGIIRRIHGTWTTKKEACAFISDNKNLFSRLIAGMGERWDGNNYIGTLTADAYEALNSLEYNAYDDNNQ